MTTAWGDARVMSCIAHRTIGEPQGIAMTHATLGSGEVGDLVVLKGHLRLTAYFLQPETIPSKIEVMVGSSPAMRQWTEY